jgi:hypothetical protein
VRSGLVSVLERIGEMTIGARLSCMGHLPGEV